MDYLKSLYVQKKCASNPSLCRNGGKTPHVVIIVASLLCPAQARPFLRCLSSSSMRVSSSSESSTLIDPLIPLCSETGPLRTPCLPPHFSRVIKLSRGHFPPGSSTFSLYL